MTTLLNQTIKKVGDDVESLKFNTAISQMMIFLNAAEAHGITAEQWKIFLQLLAPFAPHVASELWEQAGNIDLIDSCPWPAYDESKLCADTVKIGVQINGKVRGFITISPTANQEDAVALAIVEEGIKKWLPERALQEGDLGVKVIYVPGRILSFVISTGA